jgi:hypothetical protein
MCVLVMAVSTSPVLRTHRTPQAARCGRHKAVPVTDPMRASKQDLIARDLRRLDLAACPAGKVPGERATYARPTDTAEPSDPTLRTRLRDHGAPTAARDTAKIDPR